MAGELPPHVRCREIGGDIGSEARGFGPGRVRVGKEHLPVVGRAQPSCGVPREERFSDGFGIPDRVIRPR